ncbi:MAG: DnaJ C-terminal domain-containing protein, partial [Mycobacteriaceae bacterium]
DAFFGGGAGGGGGGGPRVSRVRPGNDALLRLQLTLTECFNGLEKDVTVDTAVVCDVCDATGSKSKSDPVTCPTCQGQGQVMEVQQSILGRVQVARACPRCQGTGEIIKDPCEECAGDGRVRSRRDIEVNVPAGIRDGMRIRMSGEGEVGPGGGPAGDLYVEVHVKEHPYLLRDADDLHVTVDVPMVEAALGTSVEVPLLDESVATVSVEPGTQPEAVVRVKGKGMPHLRREGFGNLIAHVDVTVPTDLDRKQQDLMEQLRDVSKDSSGLQSSDDGRSGGLFSKLRQKFGR